MFFPLPACSAPEHRGIFCVFFSFLFSPAFSLLLFLLSLPSRSSRFLPLRSTPEGGREDTSGENRGRSPRKRGKTDQNAEPFKSSPMSSGRPNIRFMFCTA